MPLRRYTAISAIALLASLLIGGQLLYMLIRGEAACLNDGCQMVAGLTAIPSFYLDLAGLAFFQFLFWTLFLCRHRQTPLPSWLEPLLLVALGADGVLLAYQIFVAPAFCSYCLVVFSLVLAANLLSSPRQAATTASLLAAMFLAFSALHFEPALLLGEQQPLSGGTYATRTCSQPAKELHLFFSADCPHCHNVIKALENCNSCDFHFNPVEELKDFSLSGIEIKKNYDPALNRLLLKLLNIDTIPVLLERTPAGYTIIRGEQRIIRYIEEACSSHDPLLYLDQSELPGGGGMSVYNDEGECSMTIDCDQPPLP